MIGPILSQVAREVVKSPSLWRIAAETIVRGAAMFVVTEGGKEVVAQWRKRSESGRRTSSRNRR